MIYAGSEDERQAIRAHSGHELVVAEYRDSTAIECADCHEVIVEVTEEDV